MKLRKTDIPDMYNELPFPAGYFDKQKPGNRVVEDGGYDTFMALDYSKLEGKQLPRLSADEMSMFATDADGNMISPSAFARYLESQYAHAENEERREEIKACSVKYIQALTFTDAYLEVIKA